jgi:eukaryotic-like serine/threonine-protein kinase
VARRRDHGGVLTAQAGSLPPGPAGSVPDDLRPDDPRQIGSYTLLARLGLGAIGPVYLGRSPGGRSVRVQVVDPGLARDPAFRLRFARDVEAASRVGGAFTAPVIDADPDAPLPWLVTGIAGGPSLAEVVGRYGPLPVPSVLSLAAGLAAGLRAVHGAGLVHGGLDPASVLLAPDGPRLTGFGLSQAAGYARLVTGAGAGVPGFTPPEQVPGEPAGPAADIFALGAVLTFAATGQPPSGAGYFGDGLGRLPGELRPPVEWCLAGNPASRPTAEQFLAALAAEHP